MYVCMCGPVLVCMLMRMYAYMCVYVCVPVEPRRRQ